MLRMCRSRIRADKSSVVSICALKPAKKGNKEQETRSKNSERTARRERALVRQGSPVASNNLLLFV